MRIALVLLAFIFPGSAFAADLTVNNNSTFNVFAWAQNGYQLVAPGGNFKFEAGSQWASGFVLFQCPKGQDCSATKGTYINRATPMWEANQEVHVLYEYDPWRGPLPGGSTSFVVGGNGDGHGHWQISLTDYGAAASSKK